jgi:glycosyltransferase involved in cell wall biosynthesis
VDSPKTSIVVPVHNRASLTRQCLSILTSTLPEDVEIVVVDDGSTDVTPKLLETYGKRLRVVRHDVAQGFASACNEGAEAARGPLDRPLEQRHPHAKVAMRPDDLAWARRVAAEMGVARQWNEETAAVVDVEPPPAGGQHLLARGSYETQWSRKISIAF